MNKRIIVLISLILPLSAYADTVTLRTGETLQGELVRTQAGFVLLRLPNNEGEALRRIAPETISSLTFEDAGTDLEAQALRRAKFIPFISEGDAQRIPQYLEQLLSTDQALIALSYAKTWHPKNRYQTLDHHYRSILIQASIATQSTQEAIVHAKDWLRLEPKPTQHSVPWQILGQHYLDSGQPENALWLALQPIAVASAKEQESLAPLHTIAATAYQELGYTGHAKAHLSTQPLNHIQTETTLPLPPSLLSESLTFQQLLKTQSPQ